MQFAATWLLESIGCCAVNAFAIVSGYLMVKRQYRYRKLISFYLMVYFYNSVVTLA